MTVARRLKHPAAKTGPKGGIPATGAQWGLTSDKQPLRGHQGVSGWQIDSRNKPVLLSPCHHMDPLARNKEDEPMAPEISTKHLRLDRFKPSDAPALAEILLEPEVTKNITADGSSPARCLASAEKRIGWHTGSWDSNGYGVWAVRSSSEQVAPIGSLVGWCGFAEPDIGDDPEILYGLSPLVWGHGLATEAARGAIDWLLSKTDQAGVSAIIFHRLNAASIRIVKKLGFGLRGTMALRDFYSSEELARDVMRYEFWRLAEGRSRDPERLLFEAPYRIGQLTTLGIGDVNDMAYKLHTAARARADFATHDEDNLRSLISAAFQQGRNEPYLEWYHLPRPA